MRVHAPGALVIELGGRAPTAVTRHARLDHDLGIGSLERVELLLRLEQQFGVRLPDAVMAETGTPADLIAAIRGAALAPKAAGWPEMMRLRDLTRAEIERLTREDREGA